MTFPKFFSIVLLFTLAILGIILLFELIRNLIIDIQRNKTIKKRNKKDEEEMKYAEWVSDEWGSHIKHCSFCDNYPLRHIQKDEPYYSNFCPHCGHRMR